MSFDDTFIYFSTCNMSNPEDLTHGDIYRLRRDLEGETELLASTGARFPYVYTLPTSPDTLLIFAAIESNSRDFFFLPKSGGDLVKIGDG